MKIILFVCGLLVATSSFAVCPLCTFAMGAGIGLTQYCGIDDAITGLWIGGLIISLIIWTNSWCKKKNIYFPGYKIIVVIGYYVFVLVPFYYNKIIGHELNKLWGVDKVLLGIVIGSVVFLAGAISYELLKNKNGGRAYFPFQKIVMPIAPLIVLSIFFYYLTK